MCALSTNQSCANEASSRLRSYVRCCTPASPWKYGKGALDRSARAGLLRPFLRGASLLRLPVLFPARPCPCPYAHAVSPPRFDQLWQLAVQLASLASLRTWSPTAYTPLLVRPTGLTVPDHAQPSPRARAPASVSHSPVPKCAPTWVDFALRTWLPHWPCSQVLSPPAPPEHCRLSRLRSNWPAPCSRAPQARGHLQLRPRLFTAHGQSARARGPAGSSELLRRW